MSTDLDQLCINTIRTLAMDGVQKAKSGHPGMPMGTADMAYVLWTRFLKHNPANPTWPNRDRFVLSAGHGSMLMYSLLHLTGYDLLLEELKNFRQWESRTPGHPEYGLTPGIETTTGPLGQGFATGVGMAVAERFLAATFNRSGFPLFDHNVYAICSDGDLMEGVSHEAASLAGHLGLGELIYLYDDNEISIEGSTDITFTEDVPARFRAYGWYVHEVDGYDLDGIEAAIRAARQETERPSLIVCRTHIAHGSPNKHDTAGAHGAPLGEEEVRLTKEGLGWPSDEHFRIPDEALNVFRRAVEDGKQAEAEWNETFGGYKDAFSEEAALLETLWAGELPEDWSDALPTFAPDDGPVATRNASGMVLQALAPVLPTLIGGSADLAPSNKTLLNGYGDFQHDNPAGRNIRFGVREHTMGAILNGMALYGSLLPYGGTFLVFSDYMRPSVRLAALMGLPVVYVYTHDSVFVGEDGPTHQPVEHLAALRVIPNLVVLRPGDAQETAEAWRIALGRPDGPTALALTRQNLEVYAKDDPRWQQNLRHGAYVVSDSQGPPSLVAVATGSEVNLALEAKKALGPTGAGMRVVSMMSRELFLQAPEEYQSRLLPAGSARAVLEAGVSYGWGDVVGPGATLVCVDRFGESAPAGKIAEHLGLTAPAVAARLKPLL